MPTFTPRVLDVAEQMLDELLAEHEDLLDQASGFGLKTAMAYPRGLMPLSEAKAIVDKFDENTAKLEKFLDNLHRQWGRDVPPDFKADWDKLVSRAQKAYDKFEADRQKAQAALEKYEDLLVGQHFQAAFQALRLKVLDLDPSEDVQVNFETELKLDADPAYATGKVKIYRGSTHLYTVLVGFKAMDDSYWGNIYSGTKRHTFKSVVSKSGHTRLPRFVSDLVGQLQALEAAEGTNVFGSRRQAPKLTLKTPQEIHNALDRPLQAKLERHKTIKAHEGKFHLRLDGSTYKLTPGGRQFSGLVVDGLQAKAKMAWVMREYIRPLLRKFNVRGTDGVTYAFDPVLDSIQFGTKMGWRSYGFSTLEELEALILEHCPEYASRLPSINVLRDRARQVGVDVSSISRSKTEVAARLRESTRYKDGQHFSGLSFDYTIKLPFQAVSRSAALDLSVHEVASRHFAAMMRQAGATTFTREVWISDVEAAYREGYREAESYYGHREGYGGDMQSKSGYRIKNKDPVTLEQAYKDMETDIDRNDKWGPSFARALSNPKVLAKEKVTVQVKARNQREAERKGRLLIEATGRIPPKATPLVENLNVRSVGGSRVKVWEATGLRKLVLAGKVDGWLFYGWAPT